MAEETTPATGDAKPDLDLGDGGKKALDAERKARREAETKAKDLETRLQALEDREKTELQKAIERAETAERKITDAEAKSLRLEVAAEKGVKARWLTGSTREELESAADEYLTDHPTAAAPAPGKPTEDLRGGGDPTTEAMEMDPRKLANSVPRL